MPGDNSGNSAAFWNLATTEPKRQFRWFLNVNGIPQWVIKTAKKPSFQVSETPHDFLNYKFYYPGRVDWQTIDITLVDPVQPDSTQILFQMLKDSGYVLPQDYVAHLAADQPNSPKTISKNAMVKAFSGGSEIYLDQMAANDGTQNGLLERWAIKNPFITSCNCGDLSYESDTLVEISLTIRYDWADLIVGQGQSPAIAKRTEGYRSPSDSS